MCFKKVPRRLHADGSQLALILAVLISGVTLGRAIATEHFAIAAVLLFIPMLLLAPVPMSLGVFGFVIPFDSIFIVERTHSLTWAIGAATGAFLLLYGVSTGRVQKPARPALWWVLFLLWSLASFAWAIDPSASLTRLPSAMSLVALYVVASSIRINDRDLHTVLRLLMVGGAIAAGYSIIQFIALGDAIGLQRASLDIGTRVSNPNDFADILLVPASLAVAGYLSARAMLMRLLMMATAGLIVLCILLTMSRGSMLALSAGCFVFLLRLGGRRRLLVLFVVLAVTLSTLPGLFYQRWSDALDSRAQGRFDIWIVGLHIVGHYGLFGAGLENFHSAFNQFVGHSPSHRGFDLDPHNIYLQVLAEEGIVGLTLLLAAMRCQFMLLRRCNVERHDRDYWLTAVEAGSWAIAVHGMSGNLLYRKEFWMTWILVSCLTRPAALTSSEPPGQLQQHGSSRRIPLQIPTGEVPA